MVGAELLLPRLSHLCSPYQHPLPHNAFQTKLSLTRGLPGRPRALHQDKESITHGATSRSRSEPTPCLALLKHRTLPRSAPLPSHPSKHSFHPGGPRGARQRAQPWQAARGARKRMTPPAIISRSTTRRGFPPPAAAPER